MEQLDDDDCRQQSEKRCHTTAVIVLPAAGALIAVVEPFLQLHFDQAAEGEPKPKVPRRRERRAFNSRGAYKQC